MPTFGLWIWAEVDAGGNLDYTLSGCGHTIAAGGPGAGGGGSVETGSWEPADFTTATTQAPGNILFAVALDSSGHPDPTAAYYELHLHDPVLGDFNGFVPTSEGHYNVSGLQLAFGSAPGVATQTQVAPAGA